MSRLSNDAEGPAIEGSFSRPTFGRTGSWVGSTLDRAMRNAQILGVTLVQPILIVAALTSTITVPNITVFLVSGIVMATGLVVLFFRAPAPLLAISHYAGLVFYYTVTVSPDEPLLSLLIPLTALTTVFPIMLQTGALGTVVSWLLIAVFGGIIAIAHPQWDPIVLSVFVTTSIITTISAILFMRYLRRVARRIDQSRQLAADMGLRNARELTLSATTAEYIRVLHDTVINTFGTLSRTRPEDIDPVEAQVRCQRDLDHISAFQHATPGSAPGADLLDLDSAGLPIRWSGITGDELRGYQALLPEEVLCALHGCAIEAIINATKHSGADHVSCDVRYIAGALQIEISDTGRGFDRNLITERGIASSLFARAEAHGIDCELQSMAGKGTRVCLTYTLDPAANPSRSTAASDSVPLRAFKLHMAMAWVAQAAFTGLMMELLSRRTATLPPYLVVAVPVLLAGIVWVTCRDNRPAPTWLTRLLLAAVPAMNWWALAAVDYGDNDPYLFQAMSLIGIPVLLYVTSPTRRPFAAAIVLHLVSIAVIAYMVGGTDAARWIEILLLEAPVLLLLTVYYVFLRIFRTIGIELADARHAIEAAERESVIREAATKVQTHWSVSNLRSPFELLQAIADGTLSPRDPDARARCADEERYLRQVSALPQDATLLSWWFALALAEARQRSVHLQLHAESARIDDPEEADALGRLMLDCINAVPENTELTISVLELNGSPHMLIVGDRSSQLSDYARSGCTSSLSIRSGQLLSQSLIEATPRS